MKTSKQRIKRKIMIPDFKGGKSNILYDKTGMYKYFDNMLKEIDEEYRTTLINFAKYRLIMFAMAKIMEVTKEEQNQVVLYLFNNMNVEK